MVHYWNGCSGADHGPGATFIRGENTDKGGFAISLPSRCLITRLASEVSHKEGEHSDPS